MASPNPRAFNLDGDTMIDIDLGNIAARRNQLSDARIAVTLNTANCLLKMSEPLDQAAEADGEPTHKWHAITVVTQQ